MGKLRLKERTFQKLLAPWAYNGKTGYFLFCGILSQPSFPDISRTSFCSRDLLKGYVGQKCYATYMNPQSFNPPIFLLKLLNTEATAS